MGGGNGGATGVGSGTAGNGAAGQNAGGTGGAQGATDPGTPSGDAARIDGGAPGCVGVISKFCDDFEKQTAGQAPTGDFTVGSKAGAIIVDTTKAYSGTKAVHITSAKPSAAAMLQFTKQFPTNDVHGRAMYYMTRVPSGIHWDVAFSYSTNNIQWEVGGMFGKFMFVVDPPDHALTSIVFPTGKWFCLQWEFKYGGAGVDNTFVAKMDSAVLDKGQFTGVDPGGQKWNAGPWRSLNVGWTGYGSSDVDIEMWIDDLAFGDQPIACPTLR